MRRYNEGNHDRKAIHNIHTAVYSTMGLDTVKRTLSCTRRYTTALGASVVLLPSCSVLLARLCAPVATWRMALLSIEGSVQNSIEKVQAG